MNKKIALSFILLIVLLSGFTMYQYTNTHQNKKVNRTISYQNGIQTDCYSLDASTIAFDRYKGTYFDSDINKEEVPVKLLEETGLYKKNIGIRWSGYIKAPESSEYTFSVDSKSKVRIWINNALVTETQVNDSTTMHSLYLKKNTMNNVKIECYRTNGNGKITVCWQNRDTLGKQAIPASAYYIDATKISTVSSIDTRDVVLDKRKNNFGGKLQIKGRNLEKLTKVKIIPENRWSTRKSYTINKYKIKDSLLTFDIPRAIDSGTYRIQLTSSSKKVRSADTFLVTADTGKKTRTENPRPDWNRSTMKNLNGWWDFSFDPENRGMKEKWFVKKKYDTVINVPYSWQSTKSGIGNASYVGAAWYHKKLDIDQNWIKRNKKIFIHFGAVDAKCKVYVNGYETGGHNGGYTDFDLDITKYAKKGKNSITIWVEDKAKYDDDTYVALVGKQGHEAPCGYTKTSGIWQTVYLEVRNSTHLEKAKAHTNTNSVAYQLDVQSNDDRKLTVTYRFKSKMWDEKKQTDVATGSTIQGSQKIHVKKGTNEITLDTIRISDPKLWDTDSPNLYYGTFTMYDGKKKIDSVNTYFGLRTIETGTYGNRSNQYILINGSPVFLSGVLDQGFWQEGIYTASSEEELKNDVYAIKQDGFNMMRKHLKIEDPLQYYWCDKLGVFVMQDMPHATAMNAAKEGAETAGRTLFEQTLEESINRDYNHPSIIIEVLFNETWGIEKPGKVASDGMTTEQWQKYLYQKVKDLKPNLLVEDMSACNYDHIQPTDLNSFHKYPNSYNEAKSMYDENEQKMDLDPTYNFRDGYTGQGVPWMNSEYGGVSALDGDADTSYCFKYQTDILRQERNLNGFVYTEPYDVEYERNGLRTYDRRQKYFPYKDIAYGNDMSIKDLVQPEYVGFDSAPITKLEAKDTFKTNIVTLNWSKRDYKDATVFWRFDGVDTFGKKMKTYIKGKYKFNYDRFEEQKKEIEFQVPERSCVGTLTVWIEKDNQKLAKNFTNIIVEGNQAQEDKVNDHISVYRAIPKIDAVAGQGRIDCEFLLDTEILDDISSIRMAAEISSNKMDTRTNSIDNSKYS